MQASQREEKSNFDILIYDDSLGRAAAKNFGECHNLRDEENVGACAGAGAGNYSRTHSPGDLLR